ncbi:epoxide hydrolase family protein [Mucilaginibacter flavidus]|uniref:epoxide hydrolase family protein n=1 Tax=Mucilaginibacter flavidus TaxID=2949309 RepID=UPI00209241F8|nr:epoxide hydrolase family protein [Mucilaginibacter flavidus]MCO5950533.1 epoxide hydrolase [Mucilaginibacter flavidus]
MKKPFKINIRQSIINDLKKRLSNTRWTDEIENSKWEYGTNKSYLKELCDYWQHTFDWKKQEEYLNSFPQFKTIVDGVGLHYIHQKGEGENSIPLLLTHGWPDSFIRFLKIIPLLTKADKNGLSFDVIIPSIPGQGFSDIPTEPGMNAKRIAKLFTSLMTEELGYEKFIAHGGDWGASIAEQIALYHSESLLGIHLTDIPFEHGMIEPKDITSSEKKYFETTKKWQMTEGAYSMIQSTKPQTLAYGLNDSPVGLAAWIIEKFKSWSDNDGDLETCFTKDELLTNLTIYWATQTINSAMRIYSEAMKAMMNAMYNPLVKLNPFDKTGSKSEVPAAFAIFPKDISTPPKDLANRFFNVQQWTEMSAGGHFAAMEQPELLADDIRKFVNNLQAQPQPQGFLESIFE